MPYLFLQRAFHLDSRARLLLAAAIIALIAFIDWRAQAEVPLGFLYLLPMLLVGGVLGRWRIAAVAALCTWLAEVFDDYGWSVKTGVPRDILYFAAFFGMGIFVHTVTRSRRLALEHLRQIESESKARQEAEEQLEILVQSSPVAILTVDGAGRILLANDAAHRLFAAGADTLSGGRIGDYLPALANVPAPDERRAPLRTVMQCRGRRLDGEMFQADVWFSTYRTSRGPRLAAMVVDTSEDLRTREELGLDHLLVSSRILVSAVSHEVRNVCGAIALVHENLSRRHEMAGTKDFEALGTLITALEKIASMELRQTAPQKVSNEGESVDLLSVLEELRIVIESALRERGVGLRWDLPADLPLVWADRQSLMQVFLNLVKNSEYAMRNSSVRLLTVSAAMFSAGQYAGPSAVAEPQQVLVRLHDSGIGIVHPERLFRPFHPEGQSTGLGLYISRALMRSFRGDLRHEPTPTGACFLIELLPAFVCQPVQDGGDRNGE